MTGTSQNPTIVSPELQLLLSQQHGVVSGTQLEEKLQMKRSAIRWLVTSKRLEHFVGTTFRLRDGKKPYWEQFAMVPTLLYGARLSHQTAALLWGIEGFADRDTIHFLVSGTSSPALGDRYKVHRSNRELIPTERSGFPVTSLARTLLDVSETLPDDLDLEIALDSAHHRRPFLEQELDEEIGRVKQQQTPGAKRLQHLLEVRGGVCTESPLETRVRRALRKSKLVKPVLQHEIFDDGRYVMRIDFAWPAHKVALHCDGAGWHNRRKQFELDAKQRSQLASIGWASLVVTKRQLESETWLETLSKTLTNRDPQKRLELE